MLQGQGSVIRQEQRKEGTYKERELEPHRAPQRFLGCRPLSCSGGSGTKCSSWRKLAALSSAPLCSHLL